MRLVVEAQVNVHEPPADDPRGHCCEPRIARLSDGGILVAHRSGTRRESADGRPHLLRSDDGGRTWRSLGRPFDSIEGGPEGPWPGWDVRGMALAELAGGDVLACAIGLDKTRGVPVYNPDGEGAVPIGNWFTRSTDGGRTWSSPWRLTGQPIPQTASQGLLALPDGDVLMTFETFKEYDEQGPWRYEGGMLRSHDGGRSWGEQVISAASDFDGDPHDTMWWDPRIARLADGRLVQFYYAFRHRNSTEGPVHVAWSEDDGRTWTPPASTGLPAQATYPIPLEGGGLIVFQQRRQDPQRMVALWSGDGGRTFDPASATVVYAHEAPSATGADGSIGSFDYLISMDRFTFGHPCGVPLDADRVLLVWYAGDVTRTSLRAAIVRAAAS